MHSTSFGMTSTTKKTSPCPATISKSRNQRKSYGGEISQELGRKSHPTEVAISSMVVTLSRYLLFYLSSRIAKYILWH